MIDVTANAALLWVIITNILGLAVQVGISYYRQKEHDRRLLHIETNYVTKELHERDINEVHRNGDRIDQDISDLRAELRPGRVR